MYFLKNEALKEKAAADASYFLDEDLEKKRNVQDIETPGLLEVLNETGLDLKNEEDVNIYLEDRYEEAVETRQVVADKQSALADDISDRWKRDQPAHAAQGDNEWWLEEDAFDFSGNAEETNPFKKH